MTVLVLDDEVIVRNFILRVLVRQKYRVWEADTAEEALEIAKNAEGEIDLLITDHTLRGMTGRQVAEEICRARPALRVLHISGYGLAKVEAEGGIVPGGGFLAKPFLQAALIEKIGEMFAVAPA